MLRFLTAGESHGRALVVILEGLPAGLTVDVDAITRDLRRRQGGYGRGRRMAIESDRADIISGVRAGETLGGPVAMTIENRDWPNWQYTMRATAEAGPDAGGAKRGPVTRPRPGHADLAAGAKYERDDLRDILERASARETAARVAAGALARQLLSRVGVRISSHVFSIGSIALPNRERVDFAQASALADDAPLRIVDAELEKRMIAEIERSDVCAVPAAAVVGEAMVALVLADALLERFGGDSIAALERAMTASDAAMRARFAPARSR